MTPLLAASAITIAANVSSGQNIRPELESFGRALELSVLQVSHPSAMSLLAGAHMCRSYRVSNLGVLFILPPRQLPQPTAPLPGGRSTAQSPELPSSTSLRPVRSETMSEQEKALRAAELQALAFQQAAAMVQLEAERALSAMAQEVESMMNTGRPRGLVEESPLEGSFLLPPEPPWRYWFDSQQPADDRQPQQVLDAVRESVARTVVEHGRPLTLLAPGESAIVITEFFNADVFDPASRPTRTLVVRALRDDLVGAHEGRLTPAELRSRLVFEEY